MQSIPSIHRRAILLVAVAGLLVGCTDLAAIRRFADASADAAQYTRIVDDYYVQSPERQKAWQPASQHDVLTNQRIQREATAKRLKAFHVAVEEYMSALGQLAADELVAYDAQVDAVGKAATSAGFVDAKEATAATGIAKILIKAATDEWRKAELRKIIQETNGHFQVVVDALENSLLQGVGQAIKNERAIADNYYKTKRIQSTDVAGIAALDEWHQLRLRNIDQMSNAVSKYGEALAKIKAGHQLLFDKQQKLDDKLLLAEMQRYAKEISKLFKVVQNL